MVEGAALGLALTAGPVATVVIALKRQIVATTGFPVGPKSHAAHVPVVVRHAARDQTGIERTPL